MYPDEPTKALAKGRAITTTHSNNGWTIRTTRAPILSVAKRSLAADSQVAWKRELGLGRATNQELPEALYGRNLLALRHDASGVRLAFDAREALRSWALLDAAPIPHRSAAPSTWDWTFTTPSRARVELRLCVARRWRVESLIAAMACWWGRSTLERGG